MGKRLKKKRYIKGLDGIRAIAVVAVILYHLAPFSQFSFHVFLHAVQGASMVGRCDQKPPQVRGKGSTSRMLGMPVRYITRRSKPRPKPACWAVPYLRSSRYHS